MPAPIHPLIEEIDMTEEQWRQEWIDTLIANGIEHKFATEALALVYNQQPIDLQRAPEADALRFVTYPRHARRDH